MAVTKAPIRWDWIEEQWQLNRLSNRAIARAHKEQFGRDLTEKTIRDYATKNGWQRDLSQAIVLETRRKLAEGVSPEEVRRSTQETTHAYLAHNECATVEAASDNAVRITLEHRGHALRMHALATQLEQYVTKQLPIDESGEPRFAYEAGELKDIAGAAASASQIRAKAVGLERQAYGMDDATKPTGVGALEELRAFLNGN
jgi:hypothetical protein